MIILAALFGFAVLLTAIGFLYERVGQMRDARLHPAPGRLVSAGDRKLHILCSGSEGPSVVIEQGAGELSSFFWPLQHRVAEFARVCTYDRAGYGWSEAAPQGRTIEDRVGELRALLKNAGIPPPYILVAHSYGGLIVRSYAARRPEEAVGLVLIDTAEESCIFRRDVLDFYGKVRIGNRLAAPMARFGVLRLLRRWVALDRYGFWLTRAGEYAALCDDLASLERVPEAERHSKAAGSLGSLPLAVITHGQRFPGPFDVLEENWDEGQRRLAALSTQGFLVVAEKSGHMIHQDEPEVVLEAIRRVHEAARGRLYGSARSGEGS